MHPQGILQRALVAAFALAASSGAYASACTGSSPFADVNQSDVFCTDTQWLANRSITLGCGGGNFCPADVVTRASMALFMQRLGTALSPAYVTVDVVTGAIDPDLPARTPICQSADFPVTGYPRVAQVVATFAGEAAGALNYRHQLIVSTNGGAQWSYLTGQINRSGALGPQWISSTHNTRHDLVVGSTYRWAIAIERESGTADFSQGRCFMTIQINSRTGASSPFDSEVTPMGENR